MLAVLNHHFLALACGLQNGGSMILMSRDVRYAPRAARRAAMRSAPALAKKGRLLPPVLAFVPDSSCSHSPRLPQDRS